MTDKIELPDLPLCYSYANEIAQRLYKEEDMRSYALAAIAADRAKRAQVPEGWKLVPMNPTDEMVIAGIPVIMSAHAEEVGHMLITYPAACYRAMLSAAAQPEQKG